jgi:pyruvate formate lyase activating enzyme
METGAILDLVMRDKDYYDASGGGLTVSGGEPFAQTPALLRLLRGAKERGLHTAVESAGQIPPEDLAAAEPFIDCFLLDIKHADPDRLADVTGADPGMIGAALEWLGQRCPGKVTTRVPVIPGFNGDEASLRGIFRLALDRGIRSLELLPYHTLGRDKYRQLGRSCPWPEKTMGDPADLALPAGWGRDMGLSITVR